MMAEQEPQPPVGGRHHPGETLGPRRQAIHRIHRIGGRLLQPPVGIALHHDPPILVQRNSHAVAGHPPLQRGRALLGIGVGRRRRFGNHAAEILAPIRPAHLVGDPHAVLGIDGQAGPGLECLERADGNDRFPLAVVEAPQEDVVIAVLVAVPGHVNIALAVGGDRRGPMVGRLIGHGDRRVPGGAAGEEDLKMLPAATLPRPPDVSLRVGRGDDVDIGARVGSDAVDRRPLVLGRIVVAAVDVPIAADVLAPGDPHAACPADRHGGLPKIKQRFGDGQRNGPRLAVELHEPNLVAVARGNEGAEIAAGGSSHVGFAAAVVGGVGHPHRAVTAAGGGRIIVVAGSGGETGRRGQSLGDDFALEVTPGRAEVDVLHTDGGLARGGIDFQDGIARRRPVGRHERGKDGDGGGLLLCGRIAFGGFAFFPLASAAGLCGVARQVGMRLLICRPR